jgi:hypothetical protein
MPEQVKIFFNIEQDEDGYPGVGAESVWASREDSGGFFVIDNIPFFATGANLGDVVSVMEKDGVFWFVSVVQETPSSLVRVVFFDPAQKDRVEFKLRELGCETEWWADRKLLALSVPDGAVLAVEAFLDNEAQSDVLDYEEPILRGQKG